MNHGDEGNGGSNSIGKYVFAGFVVVAGYFLVLEHRAHAVQYLPFLLLLACPLLHLFHGHGGHSHGAGAPGASAQQRGRGEAQEPAPRNKDGGSTPQHDRH